MLFSVSPSTAAISARDERREGAPALRAPEFRFCDSEELLVAVLFLLENNEFLFTEEARSCLSVDTELVSPALFGSGGGGGGGGSRRGGRG